MQHNKRTTDQSSARPDESATVQAERLMPYATVAKAIFVKANGLPAYRAAMESPLRRP